MKLLLTLIIVALPIGAYANCAQKAESSALDIRALQSSMMVAALSCGQQDQYNQFINRYQDDLTRGGKKIKSYFKRVHGEKYKYQLNRFITNLANKATKASMADNADEYCYKTSQTFDELASMQKSQLRKFVYQNNYHSLHGVNLCS